MGSPEACHSFTLHLLTAYDCFCGPDQRVLTAGKLRKAEIHQHAKVKRLGRGVEVAERTGGILGSGHTLP